ncbi:MAG: hypothetical protein QM796_10965 [Chthoniobacteraceae bacterium]
MLGTPTPAYLHVPVVANALGEKLWKQSGALALDTGRPLETLRQAVRISDVDVGTAGYLVTV